MALLFDIYMETDQQLLHMKYLVSKMELIAYVMDILKKYKV